MPSSAAPIYRLEILLGGVEPAIWRRVELPGDLSLRDLHRVLQAAMGWGDSHLHEFSIAGRRYGVPCPGKSSEIWDERKAKLREVLPQEGARFLYAYDPAGGWRHEIAVERVGPPEPGLRHPVCLGGRRACPPEDCGGPAAYAGLLEALADPADPGHALARARVGAGFDPEAFDLERAGDAVRLAGPRARRTDLAWLRP